VALGVGAVVLGAGATAGVVAGAAGAAGAAAANTAAAGVGGTALSGAAKLVPSGLMIATVKWLGIGAAGGLLTAGVVDRVSTWSEPARDVSVQRVVRTVADTRVARPVTGIPRSPRAAEDAYEFEEPSLRPAPARSTRAQLPQAEDVAARRARLAAEVEAVDRAREARARGNAAQTLEALDAYERGFSEQRLRPEALYLRMEALAQRGELSAARTAARALLAADPQGPHAARARAVLAGP
jgi:hypothetical protein